jgi:glucan phosphoethanolaminetransferase (alkaline phosphatase superfamily)
MSAKRRVSVPELIAQESDSPAAAFAALSKHLKSGVGEPYSTRKNYLKVLMDLNTKNVELIAQAKAVQWRLVSYAVVLVIAVTAAVQLARNLLNDDWYRIAISAGCLVAIAFVYVVARTMLEKVETDLALYREHSKLNEEMLNLTIGIHKLANRVISLRGQALSSKHDFDYSVQESRRTFTLWLHAIVTGSTIIALAVCQLLIWAR